MCAQVAETVERDGHMCHVSRPARRLCIGLGLSRRVPGQDKGGRLSVPNTLRLVAAALC